MTIYGYNPFTNNLDKSGTGGGGLAMSSVLVHLLQMTLRLMLIIQEKSSKIRERKLADLLAVANNLSDVADPSTAFDNISPLTTKGDLLVRTASDNVRLPVGPDNQVLTTDSSTAEGVKWAPQAFVFPFTEVTSTSQTMAVNTGYIANNSALVTQLSLLHHLWEIWSG